MKLLTLVLLILLNLFALETSRISAQEHQKLLDSISKHAIRLGDGPDKVFVFIDPLCPKSQMYISSISKDKEAHHEKSFYIFLYELKRFNSEELIFYIYQSEDPYKALIEIMVQKKEPDLFDLKFSQETDRKIEMISKAAKTLHIKRRPYLLLFEHNSPYCIVSDGTAPCLAEYDVDEK